MRIATTLNERLARAAELSVIGFIALLGALPLVTALASLAGAAAAAGAVDEGLGSALRAYLVAARRSLRGSWLLSIVLGVVAVAGVLDVVVVAPLLDEPAATVSLAAVGMLAAILAIGLAPFAALLVHVEGLGPGRIVRSSMRLAILVPPRGVALLGLAVLTVIAVATIPVLAAPIAGVYARVTAGIEDAATRRLAVAAR